MYSLYISEAKRSIHQPRKNGEATVRVGPGSTLSCNRRLCHPFPSSQSLLCRDSLDLAITDLATQTTIVRVCLPSLAYLVFPFDVTLLFRRTLIQSCVFERAENCNTPYGCIVWAEAFWRIFNFEAPSHVSVLEASHPDLAGRFQNPEIRY